MDAPFWQQLIDKPDLLATFMFFLVPIVAIISGVTFVIVKKVFAHRERMAMIERGIHPDYPPEDEPGNPNPPNRH